MARRLRPRRAGVRAGVVLAAGLAAAACGGDGSASGSDTVVVFAAASLTDAFGEITEEFTSSNPDVDVTLNLAGSSDLVAQIAEGAPADVVAVADLITMDTLVAAGDTAGEPVVFGTNRAEIIVAPGNPAQLTGIADLARDDLVVVQCAPEVPCGRYAEEILERAGVTVTPQSLEENVRSVVTKVILGEADAGIVYATDVLAAGDDASGVEVPDDSNIDARYPIAVTADAGNPDGARAFVDFVTGPEGSRILASYGFGTP